MLAMGNWYESHVVFSLRIVDACAAKGLRKARALTHLANLIRTILFALTPQWKACRSKGAQYRCHLFRIRTGSRIIYTPLLIRATENLQLRV